MPLVYAGVSRAEPPRDDAHARARKVRPEYTRGEPVRVAGGRNQAEAELIQNLLIEEGIPSVLRRTAGFDVPDFLAAGPRDVLVAESGFDVAREVLREAELVGEVEERGPRVKERQVALVVVVALACGGALAALIAWALIQGSL